MRITYSGPLRSVEEKKDTQKIYITGQRCSIHDGKPLKTNWTTVSFRLEDIYHLDLVLTHKNPTGVERARSLFVPPKIRDTFLKSGRIN